MNLSPFAGKRADPSQLINVENLIQAYYDNIPDSTLSTQQVEFGTSGHRGSPFHKSFNEHHILAITQAICLFRSLQKIEGPLFLGMDTHAVSLPAHQTALEVLAANGINVMIAPEGEFTTTPAISHAILTYNKGRQSKLADGIVITPSHNPPEDGGFKYNPPNGGPADTHVTSWIQSKANELLKNGLKDVKRMSYEKALKASTTHRHHYIEAYVKDLSNVIDMQAIRTAKIKLGVDPLGGAGIHYWKPIADRYGIDLTITDNTVDSTFKFMTVDWDGKIRMDPSSPYAMQGLIGLKDRFDIAFACDTDSDRHGIVTKSTGLLQPNYFLSVAIYYLFQHRPQWGKQLGIGKTLVSSQMIDRVAAKLGRRLYEVPVGFKWFVDGLMDGSLGFVGEESAGASFNRLDGSVWTTDKDGIILALLAAEITAKMGKDPGDIYRDLTKEFGNPAYERIEAPASPSQKAILKNLTAENIHTSELAGEKIKSILTRAPGNHAAIGGIKVETANGWFAARPSGTENIYKIYGESFLGKDHLNKIFYDAQIIVEDALGAVGKC